MNCNTNKNSLDSKTVNLNDRYNRAQWKFSPADLDEEIAKDIHMGMQNKVSNLLYQLLGWNTRDINYQRVANRRDPICCMFEEMKSRQMDTCPIFCCNPDVHFDEKKCYPIYKVYQVLKKIDENSAKHLLLSRFRNIILKSVDDEEKLSQLALSSISERSYSIFSLPENLAKNKAIKKNVILIIDFLDSEIFTPEDETIFYTGLNNLLENIDQNFRCMLSPVLNLKDDDRWMNFLSDQIKNCNMAIIVFSPKMVEKLNYLRSIGNDDDMLSDLSSASDPLTTLWTKIIASQKPIAGVVFDDNLTKNVSSLMPVLFELPKNMKLMLGYLVHRLHNL